MSSLKDKLPAILVGIIVGILLLLAFFGGKGYQKKISNVSEEALKQEIVQAQQEAQKWQNRYDSIYQAQTTLLLSVDSLEFRIKELKKNNAQKITIVKSYSNPELERFFTERYGSL